VQFWATRIPETGTIETQATRAEAELADLGLERVVLTGPTFGADREDARTADRLVTGEVLPALRRGAS
jgi:hypothetical protein